MASIVEIAKNCYQRNNSRLACSITKGHLRKPLETVELMCSLSFLGYRRNSVEEDLHDVDIKAHSKVTKIPRFDYDFLLIYLVVLHKGALKNNIF